LYFLNRGIKKANNTKGKEVREKITNVASEDFLDNFGNRIGSIVSVARIRMII
jgi:hypothetical protein